MKKGIMIIVFKNGEAEGRDVSQLVESVKWTGRKSSAARSITFTLIDDDGYKHERYSIDVAEGYQCVFYYDDVELFRGIIMKQKQSDKKKLELTAYDLGIYLSNNKDTYCYENKTASDIFKDICSRYEIPTDEITKCTYSIPELSKSKTSAYDAMCDALSQDFDNTGVRHYISSDKGKLSLKTRRENIVQWVVEVGSNLSTYTFEKNIEDVKTRIKMYNDENTVTAESIDSTLESKIGIFQDVENYDDSLSEAQMTDLVKSVLAEKSTPKQNLNIEALGITDVISGIGLFVIIPQLNINQTFYVDEDTHTFQDRKHTMSLKLNFASDIGKDDPSEAAKGDYSVGDIVTFNGGNHYVSSSADSPTGGTRSSGQAEITLIALGAKHPYHLIGGAFNSLDGNCNVYGWVDAGTFS